MIESVLLAEGYSVSTAADGCEALVAVETERPAVVLLDMRMPKVDGWEFARRLRERGLRVPIIVMTGERDPGKAAGEIGAEGFMAKPFDVDQLLDEVSHFSDPLPRLPGVAA